MASTKVSVKKLAKEILGVGKKLQALPSANDELLMLLEKAESILTKVDQRPPSAIEVALVPLMQMLITNEIMQHTDINILIAVACCFTELTRISAPDFTYRDADMKELFQLCIIVLKHLSSDSGRNYYRARRMLETIARLKSSAILLEVDGDEVIVEMFQLFFSAIRRPHQPADTFEYMEMIMSSVIRESRKISFKLLRPLLDSVKMENKNISPLSWELGNTVFRNCSNKLQHPLKKIVRSKNLDVAEYAGIIASLCQAESSKKNMMAKEVGLTDGTSKSGELSIYEPKGFNPYAKSADGAVAKKEGKTDQRTDLETSSRRKLLKTKGMKKGFNIQKKNGKRGIAGSSTITKKIDEQTVTETNSEGKDEPPFLDQHGNGQIRKEIILKKHESSDAKKRSRSHLGSGEDLIDLRIKVWWPNDSEYYPGTIVSFDHVAKKHKIIYDDGDEEILLMDGETWEPLDDHQIQDSVKNDTDPPALAKKPVVSKKKKGNSKPGPSKKQKASSASERAKAEKGGGIKSGEVSVPIVGVKDELNAEISPKKNDETTETLVTATQPSDGTTSDVAKD